MKQIYLHGLGQTPDSWKKTIAQLKTAECSVCPDLAKMLQGKEVTYTNLYNAFAADCDKLNEPLNLCGLSLGGVLALNYAVQHPEKVSSLVLIATPYKMPKKLLQFQNILFRFMPKSMFGQMGFGKAEFIQLCRSMMELDFSSSLKKFPVPTLVIYGEKDRANKKASIELANMLEHARLRVISKAGHEVNREAPEKLAEVLRCFADA